MADSMCKYYSLLLISFIFLLAFCASFTSSYGSAVCVKSSDSSNSTDTSNTTTTTNSTSSAASTAIKGVLSL